MVSLADPAVVMAIKSLLPPQTHFATTSMEAKFLRPVKKGVITAEAEVPDREGRELQGKVTLYDEEKKAVMEFTSVFNMARDSTIRGISCQGSGPFPDEGPK